MHQRLFHWSGESGPPHDLMARQGLVATLWLAKQLSTTPARRRYLSSMGGSQRSHTDLPKYPFA